MGGKTIHKRNAKGAAPGTAHGSASTQDRPGPFWIIDSPFLTLLTNVKRFEDRAAEQLSGTFAVFPEKIARFLCLTANARYSRSMRNMRWLGCGLLTFLLVGCGYPPPREIRSGVYELTFCEKEPQCFAAAEKTCPDGYRVTRYESSRPAEIVCE